MTEPCGALKAHESSGPSREELIRLNDELHAQVIRLRARNAALLDELADARVGSQTAREARLAALNLMEDAVEARRAQERENAERRRAELELRASEAKYRKLFESIDEGFFILERVWDNAAGELDFRIVEANPASAVHAGTRCVSGRTLREVFPGETEEWYGLFHEVAGTGEATRFERTLQDRTRVLEGFAFRLEDVWPGLVAVLFRDITERKAGEEALREADRRKDAFLATLAHELRNPLAPISNSLQILRLCLGEDAEIGDLCEMMDRQVCLMVRLVDDLLEVSRITRRSIELRRERTDLASVVRAAVELGRPLIDSLEHDLEISLPEEPLRLHGDVVRLGQVFGNLLTNAAKYTDPRGEIRLHAERSGDEIIVRVRDNGIGIGPDMLPQVFEMFTQADRSSNRARGGLGIGLTLAKQLVEMHGGSIAAFSEGLGQGSVFTVRLPLEMDGAAVAGPGTERPIGQSLHPRRVLVVDDNQDSAASLARLLRSMGIEVETAFDGASALDKLAQVRPDVVFLDIGMPGMDGLEVARRIREDRSLDGVTLIALTGWGQAGDRLRTREAGFNHHLVKPANVRELQSLLA